MQIGRFDIGFGRNKKKKIVWDVWFKIEHANCKCYILTLGFLYITWLGDECLLASRPKPTRTPRRRR